MRVDRYTVPLRLNNIGDVDERIDVRRDPPRPEEVILLVRVLSLDWVSKLCSARHSVNGL